MEEGRMKMGTKSLLFGVHQVLWHPYTVWRAWRALYGAPTWRELACIIIHDWGYWGSPEMDGEIGSLHPVRSGLIAIRLGLDHAEHAEILNHSRALAFKLGHEPSRLCWADKCSMLYDPAWFYLLRALATGEIREYRLNAAKSGFIGLHATDGEWLAKLKSHLATLSRERAYEHMRLAASGRLPVSRTE